jgi:hypothetical protein
LEPYSFNDPENIIKNCTGTFNCTGFLFLLNTWAYACRNLSVYSPIGQKVGKNLGNICRVFAELSIIRDIRLVQASKIYV